jgi:hypothetical protein
MKLSLTFLIFKECILLCYSIIFLCLFLSQHNNYQKLTHISPHNNEFIGLIVCFYIYFQYFL